jgi:hypothetical protein
LFKLVGQIYSVVPDILLEVHFRSFSTDAVLTRCFSRLAEPGTRGLMLTPTRVFS